MDANLNLRHAVQNYCKIVYEENCPDDLMNMTIDEMYSNLVYISAPVDLSVPDLNGWYTPAQVYAHLSAIREEMLLLEIAVDLEMKYHVENTDIIRFTRSPVISKDCIIIIPSTEERLKTPIDLLQHLSNLLEQWRAIERKLDSEVPDEIINYLKS